MLLARAGVLLALGGCGAVFNGLSSNVEIKRQPDTVYLVDGIVSPPEAQSVFVMNGAPPTVVAIGPDGSTGKRVLAQKISTGAIVGDVLWSLTIIGLAAPISDWLLNTWFYIEPVADVPLDTPAVSYADLSFDPKLLPRLQNGRKAAVAPVVAPAKPAGKKNAR